MAEGEARKRTEGEIPVVYAAWRGTSEEKIGELIQFIEEHSVFKKLRRLSENSADLPQTIVVYGDDRDNHIAILYPSTQDGDILVASKPGSAPIVEEVLGYPNAPDIEF